ncbi:hypothetical protein E2C01_089193 [Portunus trituberculatus]|uniref:Uncharacterized protein n=1 Tax=Portunus trituberculatus TaxID=210409 RepID=A0A5B7JI39_PORTR|nr:hypothetical protein [Portunus trituberculatus]
MPAGERNRLARVIKLRSGTLRHGTALHGTVRQDQTALHGADRLAAVVVMVVSVA